MRQKWNAYANEQILKQEMGCEDDCKVADRVKYLLTLFDEYLIKKHRNKHNKGQENKLNKDKNHELDLSFINVYNHCINWQQQYPVNNIHDDFNHLKRYSTKHAEHFAECKYGTSCLILKTQNRTNGEESYFNCSDSYEINLIEAMVKIHVTFQHPTTIAMDVNQDNQKKFVTDIGDTKASPSNTNTPSADTDDKKEEEPFVDLEEEYVDFDKQDTNRSAVSCESSHDQLLSRAGTDRQSPLNDNQQLNSQSLHRRSKTMANLKTSNPNTDKIRNIHVFTPPQHPKKHNGLSDILNVHSPQTPITPFNNDFVLNEEEEVYQGIYGKQGTDRSLSETPFAPIQTAKLSMIRASTEQPPTPITHIQAPSHHARSKSLNSDQVRNIGSIRSEHKRSTSEINSISPMNNDTVNNIADDNQSSHDPPNIKTQPEPLSNTGTPQIAQFRYMCITCLFLSNIQ